MGDAKRRQSLRDRVLGECPNCIYCGAPANTVDHMPPVTMFDLRQRPKGLEFACCLACNQGSKLAEQVASIISRAFPDPTTAAGEQEVGKLFREVAANHPGLLLEINRDSMILPDRSVLTRKNDAGHTVLWVGGPLVTTAMLIFSAKLAFALHYEATKRIIPPTGGAFVRWLANEDPTAKEIKVDLPAILGPAITLAQGAREVSSQFSYSSKGDAGIGKSAHCASFRLAFKVIAMCTDNIADYASVEGKNTFQPGFLKNGLTLPFDLPAM